MTSDTLKTIADQIQALTKPTAPQIPKESTITTQEIQKLKEVKNDKKIDRRHFNKRPPNSGRKADAKSVSGTKRAIREALKEYFAEKQKVTYIDPKSGKKVETEKPRAIIMADVMYKVALKQFDGDAHAADLWLNRAIGKAPQPIVGDEEEDPIKIDLGANRIIMEAYGDEGEEQTT